jgi:hypothetical protein
MPNQFQNPNPQDPNNNQNPLPGNDNSMNGGSYNNNDPYANYDYNNNQYGAQEGFQPQPQQPQNYDNSATYADPYQGQNNPNQGYNNYNDPYGQGAYTDPNIQNNVQGQGFAPNNDQSFDNSNNGGYEPQVNDPNYNQNYYGQAGSNPNENYYGDAGYQGNNYDNSHENQNYNQNFTPQSFDSSFSNDQISSEPNNTFVEKKSGNSKFLIAAVALIIILLIISGVMFYVNFGDSLFGGNNTSQTTQVSDENLGDQEDSEEEVEDENSMEAITDSMTGGPDTPATKSRENNETSIPEDWIIQKFSITYRDNEGNCEFDNYCGPNADPDEDGLENIYEYNFGLDPMDSDVDNDGLSDGDELFVYYTNAKTSDSDGDTYKDNEEILACTDPAVEGEFYSDVRLQEITSKISLFPLHKDTILTLTEEGGDEESVTRDGYLKDACTTKTEGASALDEVENTENTGGADSDNPVDSTEGEASGKEEGGAQL